MNAKASTGLITKEALAAYLSRVSGRPVEVWALRSLGGGDAEDPKGLGYGVPFEVECLVGGRPRSFVVSRTRPVQGFGHDYPADRAWQAIYAHAAYNTFPCHVKSLDVGFVRPDGDLVSAGDAVEYFQLVEKAPGDLYWLDLDRLLAGTAMPLDTERALSLGRFLGRAHAEKRDEPTLYHRRIRELVGHGECLMGILDSYPHPYDLLPAADCEALERQAVAWRWKLRDRTHRLSRVHGDFHPWNLLFQEGTELAVLDRSRGEWGEPADDVAALGINYLFFGLRKGGGRVVADPFRWLFDTFLSSYLDESGDRELLEVLPPFFMFRALVIAHPRWYPTLTDDTRRALLAFARAMARADTFDADRLPAYLGDAA
ncbi:MAG TPA: phosphotransferase [Candidatus Bathyarchaeia archaeon]|nr:phosphotransferase [Candidatus Bathyarchaeia archaeon]